MTPNYHDDFLNVKGVGLHYKPFELLNALSREESATQNG